MSEHDAPLELFRRVGTSIDRRKFMGVVGLSALAAAPASAAEAAPPARWAPAEGPNQPVGEAKGIHPGRVVWVHNPQAAKWGGDPEQGAWFEDEATDPVLADRMLRDSLRLLTGAASEAEAWSALFRHYNKTHGRGNTGHRPGEKVVVAPIDIPRLRDERERRTGHDMRAHLRSEMYPYIGKGYLPSSQEHTLTSDDLHARIKTGKQKAP